MEYTINRVGWRWSHDPASEHKVVHQVVQSLDKPD